MELLVILSIIFLVAFIPRFLAARSIDMTWDEGTYAFCGMTALKNIITLNFSPDAWGFEFHPPIVMYFYGIAYATYVFLATMLKRGLNLNFDLLYQEGVRLFNGRRTLLVTRLPSVVLGSLSCDLTYLLCLHLFNDEAIGITAAIFLALTPCFITWSSLSMLESGVTFFYLSTILTLLQAIEYSSVGYAIVSGIFLGLAFGSKETGLGVPFIVLPWSMLLLLRTYFLKGSSAVIGDCQLLFLWLILGSITFYVTWPWLWKNPIKQLIRNLRATLSTLNSRKGASWRFYITSLLATCMHAWHNQR